MATFAKLVNLLHIASGPDRGFESYYGSLVRGSVQGIPSAFEARRDFERMRQSLDATMLY
jgi:hypothetical protein